MTDIMKLIESLKELAERECYPDDKMLNYSANAIEALQGEVERLNNEMAAGAQNMRWMMKSHNNNYDKLTAERDALQAKLDELTAENSAMVERTGYLSVEVLVENYLTMRSQLDELQRQEPVAYSVGNTLKWHEGKGMTNVQLYAAPKALEHLTDEQIADFVGDEYHSMTESELRWFRLGEASHGITKGTP